MSDNFESLARTSDTTWVQWCAQLTRQSLRIGVFVVLLTNSACSKKPNDTRTLDSGASLEQSTRIAKHSIVQDSTPDQNAIKQYANTKIVGSIGKAEAIELISLALLTAKTCVDADRECLIDGARDLKSMGYLNERTTKQVTLIEAGRLPEGNAYWSVFFGTTGDARLLLEIESFGANKIPTSWRVVLP